MNVKIQHLFRIASVLLVLAVFLPGQASAVTALEARQKPPPNRVVQGRGSFPRLPVVAPGADGSTLALYLVEGDRATQLLEFEGMHIGDDSVIVRSSPDGEHIAALLLDSWDGASTLEVLDIKGAHRVTLDEGAGDLAPGKGAAHEDITWLAWLDDEHVLYSKVTAPSTEEVEASRETGAPLPVRGEIWLADLEGGTERLLAEAPVQRVLGSSPDGKRVYFTCHSQPGREGYYADGFCVMDVDLGAMRMLWPSADRPLEGSAPSNEAFFGYKLVTMPDGKQRVLFVGTEHHNGPPANPPDVWLADPESGEAKRLWTADQGETFPDGWVAYDTPVDFLWSPHSEEVFAYLGDGVAFGGVWWVDVGAGQTNNLLPGDLGLVAWTDEGIVVQSQEALWLLDETGEVRGEICFGKERTLAPSQVSNAVVNYDVPYVHQKWDTPEWWDSFNPTRWGGEWACGPTSAVMALAYFHQLAPHPITVDKPPYWYDHHSDYGWYVPTDECDPDCDGYTHVSACEGTNTFDDPQPYNGDEAAGAFGACVNNGLADPKGS
jgi:hypothetical protein